MNYSYYRNLRIQNQYFMLPNIIFNLGLSQGEIAVYAYLLCCEDRKLSGAIRATKRLVRLRE